MQPLGNFFPLGAAATVNSGALAGANVAIALPTVPATGATMLVTNVGTAVAFLRFDGSAAVASTGLPLNPGNAAIFECPPGITSVNVIGAAGSTIYVTLGTGV